MLHLSGLTIRYFDTDHRATKTAVVKELKKETVVPEDAPKKMYITDFSNEQVDNVSPVGTSTSKTEKPKTTSNKRFNVGAREVNQDVFDDYLKARVSSTITIRYQSTRAGSAKYWRNLFLIKFDDKYFSAFDSYAGIDKVFRRDRVVEFK